MTNLYQARGRQVVEYLTNKSGVAIIAGDVVIIDTTNDDAFTTTTTGAYTGAVGIAAESIANNAAGRVVVSGYVPLVNVSASVTRGHYLKTHTVAKQGTFSASRVAGAFGQFQTGGTTPTAILFGMSDGSTGSAGSPGTPALTLSTTNSAGAAVTLVATDATIAAFDATVPSTQAFGDAASAGSAGVAARRDHKHAMPAAFGAASYTRTAGDYTTTSGTFVDVDGTNLALTITTGARRVLIGLVATFAGTLDGQIINLDVDVDGARLGQTRGILWLRYDAGVNQLPGAFAYLTNALSAGSHTFKLQWWTGSGTATLYGSSGASSARFYVIEQPV